MNTFSINEASKKAAYKAAGFKELQEIFEDNGTVILSSGVIRKTLTTKYNFTEGQAAGTIRRATIKKLLFAAGNSEYIYNIDFPHSVAEYITATTDNTQHDAPEETINMEDDSSIDLFVSKNILDMVNNMGTNIDIINMSTDTLLTLQKVLLSIKQFGLGQVIDIDGTKLQITEICDEGILMNMRDNFDDCINNIQKDINITDIDANALALVHLKLTILNELKNAINI